LIIFVIPYRYEVFEMRRGRMCRKKDREKEVGKRHDDRQ